ncbi:hypothetical protein [Leptospira borgpetersenii]|uniref:Hydrolase, carbon-nitrogen family n=2 Tax=Leptospira borgpetersenii serovar Hardjo-bovis TaxID=338217 RepID=Q04W78_LEPBJ|nr:hypothetical protein [Leptospira borgpetersenii]ABJ74842.1 Conserved hypothetical protein [Leptospira borgpetersenii serovar Hardjo-bovis str. JB197]ABJ77673.1 Conserved hypothetical protein [Leptospira borgpetersenii serovar Hardjo-bovis str. L550]AMX56880.1 hypothetical protein LBK6_00215 [Leptospira borgpetersenii serovar Hardjo]AMX60111.1 hypothetical protein LBK9_00215 [Leptospira borgpetersenii serovar Hardjo]AMX63358.1 hypothetical protein LBK30_00215 [Leptospira borgpetersenii serov
MSPFWKNATVSLILIPVFLGIAYIFSGKQISSEQYNKLTQKEYQVLSNGYDRNAGNIVVIQPEWKLENFSSEERFLKSIELPLKQARQKGFLKKSTLVVFPPHTGSFLYFLNSRQEVFRSNTLEEAFNFIKLEIFLKSTIGSNTTRKSNPYEEASAAYLRIFSNLSKTYGVYILPGSILMPIGKVDPESPNPEVWQEVVYIFDPNKQISLKDNILTRTPTAMWMKNLAALRSPEIANASGVMEDKSLTIYQFPFARFGIFYLDDFKNPEFQEKVKKTFVSRLIAIGENSSETQLKEWATKSNIESTIRTIPSGSFLDKNYGGGSYIKTRYGFPTPGVNSREPLLLNLFL